MLSSLVVTDKWVHQNVSILNSTLLVIHLIVKTLIKMTEILFEYFPIFVNTKHKKKTAGLKDVNNKYCIFLKRWQLQMMNNRLIFYKTVMVNRKYLALIVVPQILQKGSSDTTTSYQWLGIWVNMRHLNVWDFCCTGHFLKMISNHGFRAMLTIPHKMFREITKANYTYLVPSRRHSG